MDHYWQTGKIQANGIGLHYYRTGGNLPQVVLSHGALDDGLCWTRIARALEEDYDLILLDARGHGLSDSGAGDYSTETRAADLIALIEELGLEKPVIGGHSMGAVASLYAVAMRPDLISGFFLEDPSITCPGESLFGGEAGKVTEVMFKGLVRLWRLFRLLPRSVSLAMARRFMGDAPPEEIEPWLESKRRASDDFIQSIEDPGWLLGNFDLDLLEKVESPGMLIYGDRDQGAIVSHQMAEELGKRIHNLRIVHLEGATHDIRRTRYDGYIRAISSFLKEING